MKNLYDDVFLYDSVHGEFAESEAFDFYRKQISNAGSPVLELACGSGRVLIPLAENEIQIFGLDASENMLAACQRKANERKVKINIERGDMREFDLGRKFNVIYIAGSSLQHLTEIKDVSNCFDSVKQHLTPDGKFIVELQNPYIPLLIREVGKKFMVGSFGDYVLTEDVKYNVATQIKDINWHFWHRPTDKITTLSFSLRQFFPRELDALFELKGFHIEKKFGDFSESTFSNDSLKQIIVASPN